MNTQLQNPRTPNMEPIQQQDFRRVIPNGTNIPNGGVLINMSPRSYAQESASISNMVQDHHVVVIRQAEEIRRLRRQLLEVTNERDTLLCELHHLKMGILANELGRLGESSMVTSSVVGEEERADRDDSIGPSHVNMGTCVDDELGPLIPRHHHHQINSIYSSSEMTRLSSSSASSSPSSSPVLFKVSSTSSSTQFHDSSEETGETGVVARRYGGPPARDAALVIQRAFRRYSMVKEFQRIKTERRLSRRINNNVPPATPGTNGYTICVDLDHGEPEHHAEICVGDDEEDDSIHSGELSHSPCLDTGEADVVESSGSNGHLQSQWTEDARNPQLHSSPHMLGSGGAGHHPSNSDTSVLASSRHPSNYNRYHEVVPIQHLHPYHHQQLHFSGQGPPGPHPVQYFHHTQLYAPSGTPSSNAGKFQGHKPGSLGSSPNSVSSSSPALVLSNSSSPSSNHVQKQQSLPRQMSDAETEVIRKRLYRVGLNLFNKKPEAGILYLVKKKFLEGTSPSVARFLISRKGLSKQMIGEYLANLQSPFSLACLEHFASEIDLSTLPIDLSLRRFQSFLRMPGEAQKIERIMETFSRRYAVCNPHVVSQFRNGADTVFVLAFAIIMLNTDLHTPHLKQDRRMKMEDFIKNLRGIDDGGDIDREMLVSIYERIKETEFRTGSDHVTQVMKVQQTIVGKKPNLALPHRRLVCYCRLYEVADINKKEKSGSHQREVFLFNDILVLTKIFHKKRNSVTYSFRQSYPLNGITLLLFTNQYYDYGMCLKRGDTVLLNLNARNEHDRAKFAEDLREAIAESDEMVRIESLSKENRDSGVDVGKMKRYSNSLLDINDQCKPVRRGSCGSLDSGMSISFHSDELHQQQVSQQQSSVSSQSSCLTTTHPPPIIHHQHQGSSCSNSSSSTSHSK